MWYQNNRKFDNFVTLCTFKTKILNVWFIRHKPRNLKCSRTYWMVVGFYFVCESYEKENGYFRVPLPKKVRVFITKLIKRSVRCEENRLKYTAFKLIRLTCKYKYTVNTSI